MPKFEGRFVWYELMTTDTEAAQAFYGKVVGWGAQNAPVPGVSYTLFTVAEMPVAGLMQQPEEVRKRGAPPSWLGYVGVANVDTAAAKVARLGGTVHVPPSDIPNVGRFAVVLDPQHVAFALFQPAGDEPDRPVDPSAPGRVGWHELATNDWPKAFSFYNELFSWQKGDAVDIGAMGTYQLFTVGGQAMGGMFNKPPAVPAPFWLYYVNVGDIDAAAQRVTAGGGKIINGPMQVPGGSWILQSLDPQGAMFALVGRKG
ncbi:MAG TPA: VOC family protein [Stellaceae bacterium]|nr:VOC family protein [Stellaceae bacterium]